MAIPVVLSPAAVAANTTAEQVFPLPAGYRFSSFDSSGSGSPQVLIVNKPTAQAGLGIVGFRIVDPNNFAITFENPTAAAITPTPNETYLLQAVG